MKTKNKRNAQKEKAENPNKKRTALTEEEMDQVAGGNDLGPNDSLGVVGGQSHDPLIIVDG